MTIEEEVMLQNDLLRQLYRGGPASWQALTQIEPDKHGVALARLQGDGLVNVDDLKASDGVRLTHAGVRMARILCGRAVE